MKTIRNKNQDLEEMLKELKIGEQSIYDEVSNYEITKVPNGFIYKNEYVGLVFVPDFSKGAGKAEVAGVPNSVAKTSPKKVVEK